MRFALSTLLFLMFDAFAVVRVNRVLVANDAENFLGVR